MVPEWLLLGSALALAALNAALSVYWLRQLRDDTDAPEESSAAPAPSHDERAPADGTVRCRSCGAQNDAEYRYCRECVAELPARTPSMSGSAGPRSRPF